MASGFKLDAGNLLRSLTEIDQRTLYAAETIARTGAKRMEGKAKEHPPWQDRSGDARKYMRGDTDRRGAAIRIKLSGNVSYHVYLEFANGKKYAIIWPTMRAETPAVMRAFASVLRR